MRLWDVARINPTDGPPSSRDGRWTNGFKNTTRACAVDIEVQDHCANNVTLNLMGATTSRPGQYDVIPFAPMTYLRQSVSCELPDDKDWLLEVNRAKLDYIASWALVAQFGSTIDTWIGDPGVQTVTLAGTSAAQYRTAVAAAYDQWHATVANTSAEPLMHVPPALVPDLQAASILMVTSPTEISSVYSPKVVSSPGYDKNQKIFFSGSIDIYIGEPEAGDSPIYNARMNDVTISASTLMALDVAPCSMVRVG